ncbi:multidrug ABC transporter ATP-binding protein [Terrabacter tumescens]|uniref:Multidrug ABC transporter ATP-binding protein n=1 Tax=Terrabacter tumescens TaxID=60443 RepID=A0ABQ2HTH5_9MICO|nr:ABC transporter ATP-binding protein [Terrabacter tumescens]GGM90367.1 multidrug ABC transporter ATP-binding protein [Terrabacter tumescens]
MSDFSNPLVPGAGGGGGGKAKKIDPLDRAQLAESPVSMRRVARLFRPHARTVAVVVALIVATSVISMGQPFLLRAVIDDALPHHDVHLLLLAVGGMLAVTVVSQLLGVVQTWLTTTVGQRVMHGLRTDVFRHVQRQSIAFFTRTRSGEVQSRLTHDIAGMQSVITSSATGVASNLTTVVATAIAMVALSARLSLLSLLVIPPAVLMTRKVALVRRDITTLRQRRLADLHSQVEEGLTVSGATLIKTLGAAQAAADRFAATSTDLIDLELRSQLAGRWRMATMQIMFAAIPALIYLAAGLPATAGAMTIGTLIAFTTLQTSIFRPLMGLLDIGAQWVTSMALFSRIFGYLDLPVEVAPPADPVPVQHDRLRGEVRFENVTFSHEPGATETTYAVDDVSLLVPAGTTLALVGETGSGKSSLAGLLARLHDPQSGRVTIDGLDLRDLDPADLSRIVGVVSQDAYLVHASIRTNLLLADPGASEDQLWEALAAAQVAPLVASLPDGLDTVVGARGHRFSGGEKQRIAIARTLLRNPRVLILDEATSALDNETERDLQVAIDRLMAGRTTLTIAHRLSTIRDAEQIAVLDHGRVVELGDHPGLMARGGRYARLVAARETSAREAAAA